MYWSIILLLPSPTKTVITTSKHYIVLVALFYSNVLGITSIILLPSHIKTSLYCLVSHHCIVYFIIILLVSHTDTIITISNNCLFVLFIL